jgi:type IV pilus assembly protein PilM
MAYPKAAWGIEIGACAIKAIRLEREGDNVSVSDFAVIPHKKVLTTPDLDQDEMVRLGLGQFISQRNLEGEHLVMSVPGHSAFARFAKLPPVDPKKVPDIVKFEAVQQIPFPIDDVEWDYQTFTSEDTPEVEVGIFAITRERVQQRLGLYGELGISPEMLTLSPVAVYNAMFFDHALGRSPSPILYLDIGTSATDVIVADEGRCWIRTFPLGGTHFTEAIAEAFKLSYSKADKLKQEAATSKYAKQIMQAMRPVFSDLLQDLQRSIGYYQALHPESTLTTMVGLGSTFKIPGLRKFLGQQLQIDVVRLDEYRKIAVKGRQAASFAENAVNMATAYGLALQGVGAAAIDANLVPVKALREQIWHAKTKWFAAAAAIVIAGSAMMLYRPLSDQAALRAGGLDPVVNQVLSTGKELQQQYETLRAGSNIGAAPKTLSGLFDYRRIWPYLVHDASVALASSGPQEELLSEDLDTILQIDPKQRRLVVMRGLEGDYVAPSDADARRRIRVTMTVEVSHDRPVEFLNQTVLTWLRENAEPEGQREDVPYRIVVESISSNYPTGWETVSVGAGGELATTSPQGTPTRPTGAGGMPGRPTGVAPMAPPGGQPSAVGGGGVAGGARGGGTTVAAPGGTLAASAGGQSGVVAPSGGVGGTGKAGGGRGPGGTSGAGGRGAIPPPPESGDGDWVGERPTIDMDTWAPIPDPPAIYPPDTQFHRVPVTFEIEILDARSPASPPKTADGGSREVSS